MPGRGQSGPPEPVLLVSVAADVDITEPVDGNKGVHVMLPKAIFTQP
jgi:acetamidase/formamidase